MLETTLISFSLSLSLLSYTLHMWLFSMSLLIIILMVVIIVQEGAVCLLLTIMTFFPSSIHRHYDSVSSLIFPLSHIRIFFMIRSYFSLSNFIFFDRLICKSWFLKHLTSWKQEKQNLKVKADRCLLQSMQNKAHS